VSQGHSSYDQRKESMRLELIKRSQAIFTRRQARSSRKTVIDRFGVVVESGYDEGETQVEEYRVQSPEDVHSDRNVLVNRLL
jgi:hypothetical protein